MRVYRPLTAECLPTVVGGGTELKVGVKPPVVPPVSLFNPYQWTGRHKKSKSEPMPRTVREFLELEKQQIAEDKAKDNSNANRSNGENYEEDNDSSDDDSDDEGISDDEDNETLAEINNVLDNHEDIVEDYHDEDRIEDDNNNRNKNTGDNGGSPEGTTINSTTQDIQDPVSPVDPVTHVDPATVSQDETTVEVVVATRNTRSKKLLKQPAPVQVKLEPGEVEVTCLASETSGASFSVKEEPDSECFISTGIVEEPLAAGPTSGVGESRGSGPAAADQDGTK